MIIRFNIAQLERERCEALGIFLADLQQGNKAELDVSVVEFPKKFLVKLADGVEIIIAWDDEKKVYAGVVEPEPKPEPESEPEVIYVRSMACDLVRCIKLKDIERRQMLWIEFCSVFMKELLG